jgi:hypothetical protein
MRLPTLQLYLRSLLEPLAQSGAAANIVEELRQACDALRTFGDMPLAQFVDEIRQAEEYRRTREIAVPGYLRPQFTAFDRVRALRARAAMPDVNREELVPDLQALPLDKLETKDLVQITTDLGGTVDPKAKKADAIDAVWRLVTGEPKPKRAPSRTAKPKPPFPVEEFAQKVNDLKERANSPESTREELEQGLKALNLDKLTTSDLVELGRQLSLDVNSKTRKEEAIREIERVVLVVKESALATAQ